MNFRYINLHTRYTYHLISVNKEDIKPEHCFPLTKNLSSTGACFYKFFVNLPNYLKSHCKMSITVYTTQRKNLEDSSNNYMMISQEQLDWYLNYLNTVVPFTYKKSFSNDYMTLSIEMDGNTHFANKWLVSSIRNIYEYPQSWALREAIDLKELGFFPEEENIINVVNAVLRGKVQFLYDQYVCHFKKDAGPIRMTTDQVKEQIEKLSESVYSVLNNIYTERTYDEKEVRSLDAIFKNFNEFILDAFKDDFENIFSPENIILRYKLIYKNIYKKMQL